MFGKNSNNSLFHQNQFKNPFFIWKYKINFQSFIFFLIEKILSFLFQKKQENSNPFKIKFKLIKISLINLEDSIQFKVKTKITNNSQIFNEENLKILMKEIYQKSINQEKIFQIISIFKGKKIQNSYQFLKDSNDFKLISKRFLNSNSNSNSNSISFRISNPKDKNLPLLIQNIKKILLLFKIPNPKTIFQIEFFDSLFQFEKITQKSKNQNSQNVPLFWKKGILDLFEVEQQNLSKKPKIFHSISSSEKITCQSYCFLFKNGSNHQNLIIQIYINNQPFPFFQNNESTISEFFQDFLETHFSWWKFGISLLNPKKCFPQYFNELYLSPISFPISSPFNSANSNLICFLNIQIENQLPFQNLQNQKTEFIPILDNSISQSLGKLFKEKKIVVTKKRINGSKKTQKIREISSTVSFSFTRIISRSFDFSFRKECLNIIFPEEQFPEIQTNFNKTRIRIEEKLINNINLNLI